METTMTNNETTRGRAQDRAKVAGGQDHEVRYEAGKTGADAADQRAALADAVQRVGADRHIEQAGEKKAG